MPLVIDSEYEICDTGLVRKTALIIVATLLVIASIGGIFFYRQSQPESLGQVTLGWTNWPGNLPYLVAYDQGIFKKEGLNVSMVVENNVSNEIDDLVAGKTDFSADVVLLDVIKKVSNGGKLKVVLANDYSNGADGIVAKKEIKNISDLKGKKVSVEMGTLGEYLLYDALKKSNLSLSDIQIVNLSAIESAQAFIRGEVVAAVTYEPDYSKAVKNGNGWRLYTSADSPGLIIDVLTFNNNFATKNPTKITAVVKSYFKAIDFIAKNPDRAYEIGAKFFKVSPSELKEQYLGLKQVGFEDNLKIMFYGSGSDSLHGLTQSASNFLQTKGTVMGKVDSTEIIDPSFIRELNKEYVN